MFFDQRLRNRTASPEPVLPRYRLGVADRFAGRGAVMYAGRVIEEGQVDDLLRPSAHPCPRRHGASPVRLIRATLVALVTLAAPAPTLAASVEDLVRAYPDALSGFDGTSVIWRDGTRMTLGDVVPGRSGDEVLRHGSILDQLATPYPAGAPLLPPQDDPGRVRNQAFFDKMYGDCHAGTVSPHLVHITWLPKSWGHEISITSINGVDRRLDAISQALDALPAEDKKYLYPIGGTYNCRPIAGTEQTSMHSWGVAIDLNVATSDYWRWSRSSGGFPPYRNRIPPEVVAIFERNGFIWGGRWAHFDTMHFEYRPELLGHFADGG